MWPPGAVISGFRVRLVPGPQEEGRDLPGLFVFLKSDMEGRGDGERLLLSRFHRVT